jgi:hypothetical protein
LLFNLTRDGPLEERHGGFPNAGYEPHPSCAKISRKIFAGQQ